jgi:hypothetical protein
MLTIYFTWSPWHYTGQNYGLAVMFLRRRGVPVTPTAKRFVYATFILSYALVFVMLHASSGANVDAPLASYRGSSIHFRPLGIPQGLVDALATGIVAAYAVSLAGAGWLLLRQASWRDLVPTALLALTQALWFSIPFAVHSFGLSTGVEPLDWRLREHYLSWIVFGRAVQYLWVTTYYARATDAWRGYGSYLGKTLLAGLAVWTLPAALIFYSGVGRLPYWLGMGLLVTAAINIHHFILDGAIWKLRNSRIANVLIRSAEEEPGAPTGGGGDGLPWLRRGVWAVAAAGTAIGVFCFWQKELVAPAAVARRDFAGARAALDRLAGFGVGNPVARQALVRAESEYDARLQRLEAELGEQPGVAPALALG